MKALRSSPFFSPAFVLQAFIAEADLLRSVLAFENYHLIRPQQERLGMVRRSVLEGVLKDLE